MTAESDRRQEESAAGLYTGGNVRHDGAMTAPHTTAPIPVSVIEDAYGNPAVAKYAADGTVQSVMMLAGSDRGRITHAPLYIRPVTSPESVAWALTVYTAVTGRQAVSGLQEADRAREAARILGNKRAAKAERLGRQSYHP